MSDIVLNEVKRSDSNCSRVSSAGSNVSSEPSSPGEAFKDLKLRKTGGEILLSRYLKFVNPEQSGYVGFANLPNQVHRKSVKKGFEFTLMVVGESGLGKSTLVNSLFLTDLYPERLVPTASEKIQQTVKIDASTVEIEERGVKLRLTVVDTPGFGDSLNSVDCFKPIIQYVDDQFERYLNDESGLNRRHIIDNRVHCCFYFINPSGHGLRPLDIAFMKAVHHKVNIVPVLAKADLLTKKEVLNLKKKVMQQIEQQGISLYPLPDCDDDEDEDYKEQCRQLKAAVPFAVVGSNTIIEVKGKKVRGRMYPWGVVEVENPDHCDFIKLRTMLITHMQDLQEVTQEVHYENFRAERLASGAPMPAKKPSSRRRIVEEPVDRTQNRNDNQVDQREQALQEKEKELRKMQEMLAKMQAEMDAQKGGTQNGVRSHNV
ncbi:septin-2B-like isoform X5 [Ruditapes philippinarum]|uniref:septin-2B-like isoform X5 n=1 Tax=Ruditapes philippinarum TaxID=129788 RepID=UPI00295BD4B9|nr:septin-2B-like isoform X5 [Ruditapes philippinarum]XP_060563581.1 septin-2B-like isoform X5 [Ruditapes philippinarum]XP_060563583.1 septin-2B-like isoform X5 [Ruditapes philippinarum]